MPPLAVVTGAAKGIGRATVIALARHGMAVSAWDLDGQGLTALVQESAGQGWQVRGEVLDVSNEAAVAGAADHTRETMGPVRYLFNSAGIQTYGTVLDTDGEEFSRTLRVNLFSQFFVAKHVVPMMIAAGSGAVVNTTSAQAFQCQERVLAYAASKGAVLTMTKSMALDLAPHGIRVNAIAPGSIDTPMLRWAADQFSPQDPDAAVAAWGKLHPLGRVGTPEEVAALVVFLLTEATFMTGAIVPIDGGLTTRLM